MAASLRPIKRFVLLLDDQEEQIENGVIINHSWGAVHLDYQVVRVGASERCDFGVGDTVVLCDPNAGRRLKLDGVVYRLVKASDIIAVCE
jgi:co-chaperonin GroES (HSP10)